MKYLKKYSEFSINEGLISWVKSFLNIDKSDMRKYIDLFYDKCLENSDKVTEHWGLLYPTIRVRKPRSYHFISLNGIEFIERNKMTCFRVADNMIEIPTQDQKYASRKFEKLCTILQDLKNKQVILDKEIEQIKKQKLLRNELKGLD